jgi:hypothetical protein
MKIYTFELGEYGEGYSWDLVVNSVIDNKHLRMKLCCHAQNVVKKSDQHGEWDEGILPRSVVAANEGGCNSTVVCLDCILDGLKKIESGEVQPTKNDDVSTPPSQPLVSGHFGASPLVSGTFGSSSVHSCNSKDKDSKISDEISDEFVFLAGII